MNSDPHATLPLVIINGIPSVTVSIHDRAFQYGDGLFETIAIVDGKPALLERHLQRLKKGLHVLGFPPLDNAALANDIKHHSGFFSDAVLKLIVTRGESKRGYKAPEQVSPTIVLSFSERNNQPEQLYKTGISVRLCQSPVSINPKLAGLKHLNRLDQVLARSEWSDNEITEGLMCDPDGNVIEATSANLFLWKDNELLTPDLTRCGIAGVVRDLVMDIAQALDISCVIKEISIPDCQEADALFLTNSLIGILPVSSFETITYSQSKWPHKLFEEVMNNVFT
mgnify:CR=1 FL=1